MASLLSRVTTTAQTLFGTWAALPTLPVTTATRQQPPKVMYALLRAMYLCNGLYDDLSAALYVEGVYREALRPLRNPAYRVVEFYVAKVWPGTLPEALPIETDNESIVDAIRQIWAWSNWGSQKQVFTRWVAMYGDVFVKVVQRADKSRVYFQLIDPQYVVDFDTDERGYLTYLRVDVPRVVRTGDQTKTRTFTEVWSKQRGDYRTWEHDQGDEPDLDRLGTPGVTRAMAEFGIDFLPFVHCQFRDIGESRGLAAYTHAIDKIDEANRQATRLHQMLFRHNRNTWVIEGSGALVREGRAIPAPQVRGLSSTSTADEGTVNIGDEHLAALPSGWTLKSAVPQIDYDAALNVLNAHMMELEKDLPEMAYYRLKDLGSSLSGRAVRLMLSDAIDKVIEARGNAEDALIRLHQMALTIGKNAGLFGELQGTFEDGDFDHSFEARDVLPADDLESAQAEKARADAALVKKQLGWTDAALQKELGLSDDEIADMAAEKEASAEDAASAMLTAFERGGNAPVVPAPPANSAQRNGTAVAANG